jgi:hypothetical protein
MLLLPLVTPPWLPLLMLLLLVPAVLVLCSCCAGCCPVLSCSLPDPPGTCPVAGAGVRTLLLFPALETVPLLVASCAAAAAAAAAVAAPAGTHPAGPQPPVTWTSLSHVSRGQQQHDWPTLVHSTAGSCIMDGHGSRGSKHVQLAGSWWLDRLGKACAAMGMQGTCLVHEDGTGSTGSAGHAAACTHTHNTGALRTVAPYQSGSPLPHSGSCSDAVSCGPQQGTHTYAAHPCRQAGLASHRDCAHSAHLQPCCALLR